jgi:cysteinyl-tRNA synthetase
VALGRPFARRWMHHAFVEVAGEKMSKSLGNFTTLTDLLASTDPRAYRLLVLQSQYRKPLEVRAASLEDATRALGTLDDFARRSAEVAPASPDAEALERFRARMDDDLDTPGVVADVAELRRRANALLDGGDATGAAPLAAAVREITGALGLPLAGGDDRVDEATAVLVRQRDEARARKDWGGADAIRSQLEAQGWVVEDTPGGTRLHR